MITLRKSEERGHFSSDWLDSRHTFSFDTYHDSRHMGFCTLRVINEDRVQPGHGFPLHPHRDMEILTLILDGALEHRDSLGSREIIRAGEVQRITAGTGIRHSETNPSSEEAVHLLQIWILPEKTGLEPGYEVMRFVGREKNRLWAIASRDGGEGAAKIHQDVVLFTATLEDEATLEHTFAAGRHGWLQVLAGTLLLNGLALQAGDGAKISEEERVSLTASGEARLLLFDLS